MTKRAPIDFVKLAAELLQNAERWVEQWLPGGKRRGHEYVCATLSGGEGGAVSVNLVTGAWADFAGDDKGGDLISLYAAVRGLNNGQAAHELMGDQAVQGSAPAPAPAPAKSTAPPARRESMWVPIAPVPADTPAAKFLHFHRGEAGRVWKYEIDGQLYGYVCRFETSDGGKEILPLTWCEDTSDGRGTRKWSWKQWAAPRPLYMPRGALSTDARPVVVVEGEKCADAGHALLGEEFDFITWPGGGKAAQLADWYPVIGRTVYLWPDCDAKRERLSKAERDAGADPQGKALLPEANQPGVATMQGLAAKMALTMLAMYMVRIPAPGVVSDGWDVADAVAQGWDADMVRAFILGADPMPSDLQPAANPPPPSPAGASGGNRRPERVWQDRLVWAGKSGYKACRENVVCALDGVPAEGLAGIPEAAGVVAFNEFTNDVLKLRAAPWRTAAGVWQEEDELELGNWLTFDHALPPMPRGTLEEAILMVSKRHRFHPVRAYLGGLRGQWDGTKRLATWLQRTCGAVDAEVDPADALQLYLARVGTWFVMAMCARVLRPGSKFDCMLILEGGQGVGKSTLARTLGGEWFADTGLVLGEKDSYQNLQGIWVYEWGELDSLSRAEVTKVKQFVSSQTDRFRASFDRRPADYPRQVVFIGTTNEDHYLVDPTGNRRFWPVQVHRQIDIAWMVAARDQLFAEALVYLEAGERFHPIPKEQRELFDPQQQARTVEGAIEAAVVRYLYDEDQKVPHAGKNGALINEISAVELLGLIGIGLEKLGPGRWHEKQAASALRKLGWIEHRPSGTGPRPRVYRRPGIEYESAKHGANAGPDIAGATSAPF